MVGANLRGSGTQGVECRMEAEGREGNQGVAKGRVEKGGRGVWAGWGPEQAATQHGGAILMLCCRYGILNRAAGAYHIGSGWRS